MQGIRGIIILAASWSAAIWHIIGAAARTDLTPPWQAAQIIPAVIIALYITGFVYQACWYWLTNRGLINIAEVWCAQLSQNK